MQAAHVALCYGGIDHDVQFERDEFSSVSYDAPIRRKLRICRKIPQPVAVRSGYRTFDQTEPRDVIAPNEEHSPGAAFPGRGAGTLANRFNTNESDGIVIPIVDMHERISAHNQNPTTLFLEKMRLRIRRSFQYFGNIDERVLTDFPCCSQGAPPKITLQQKP